jgi:hypothetical protein
LVDEPRDVGSDADEPLLVLAVPVWGQFVKLVICVAVVWATVDYATFHGGVGSWLGGVGAALALCLLVEAFARSWAVLYRDRLVYRNAYRRPTTIPLTHISRAFYTWSDTGRQLVVEHDGGQQTTLFIAQAFTEKREALRISLTKGTGWLSS